MKINDIEVKPYNHTCSDGCCDTYGYDVYINGNLIGFTVGGDAYETVQLINEYIEENKNKES